MKKVVLLYVCCMMTMFIFSLKVSAQNNYIVEVKNKHNVSKIKQKYSEYLSDDNSKELANNSIVLLENLNAKKAKKIRGNNDISIIEKDYQVSGNEEENSRSEIHEFDEEWNYKMVNLVDQSTDYSGVKVAIIDSGVDGMDFNIALQKDFITPNATVKSCYYDFSGHGTSVAGIIGAKNNDIGITGVAQNISLYSAKVLDSENTAPVSRVVEAIYWAIDNDVDIINMSLGTLHNSQILKNAINEAYNNGIVLVASAGNNGENLNCSTMYPAAYEEVLSVGSVDSDAQKSTFSATGEVDVVAPGELILTTGAFDGIIAESGTSFAAPHISGFAAQLLYNYPELSNNDIYKIIKVTAKNCGNNSDCGYGVIDIEKGIENAINIIDNEDENTQINSDEIEIFEEPEYVQGLWARSRHSEMAVNGVNGHNLTNTQIKYIKIGSVLQDCIYPGYGNVNVGQPGGKHPYFHANGNYIAYSFFLRDLARSLYNSGSNKNYKTIVGNTTTTGIQFRANNLSSVWTTACKNDMYNLNWETMQKNSTDLNEYLEEHNLTVNSASALTDRNKSWIVLGMATHIVGDTFAHETYVNSNATNPDASYTYNRLLHDDGADVWNTFPQRHVMAQTVINGVIDQFVSNVTPTLAPWLITPNTFGNSFRLNNILGYCYDVNAFSDFVGLTARDYIHYMTYYDDVDIEMAKRN